MYELFKSTASCVIGAIIGVIPAIAFSGSITILTIVRLPINVFKTYKVTITTIIIRKNLRILLLMILPVVHVLFPIIVLILGLAGALTYFTTYSIACIYEGERWMKPWNDFRTGIKKYWEMHVNFVKVLDTNYDHPTGIPQNWQGTIYGLPIGPTQIIFGLLLTIHGIIICGAGTFLVITPKWIPMIIYALYNYAKIFRKLRASEMIIFSPFFTTGLVLAFLLIPILYIWIILLGTICGLQCPYVGINDNNVKQGFIEAFNFLKRIDQTTKELTPCNIEFFAFYNILKAKNKDTNQNNQQDIEAYWDSFADKCIKQGRGLLENKWLVEENIEAADPSIIIDIPAVTVLYLIRETILENNVDIEPLSRHLREDNIIQIVWGKLDQIGKIMKQKPALMDQRNIDHIIAKICSNQPNEIEPATTSGNQSFKQYSSKV